MVWLGSSLYVTGAAKAEAANSERAVASAMRFMGVLRMWCVLQRWNARLRLLDSRGFVEAQPRRTREDAGRVALAEVDEEVGLDGRRSEEHTSELQSLMRISYAVFCLKKKKETEHNTTIMHALNG